ncbi:hypothetical protein BAUCODRAFT_35567 [Baudoinia panamericana UAMH 10762]|uniref:PDEase domain-containing protein n=1 Tax=Baudoinia panamericana (strain UAMH 10762) TaxID=717646 RepID=M2N5P2_BAUPA|nr:uncharacterized protein BAUCODRAFT_35567 [Baudoinia panamericana UAMH 10762]EMC94359.1 hypothetical protein BAUCODRAFT_35567 [Baudoinia panamericana UAMH 10762]
MISNILATDMQRHFEYMGSLGELKKKVESSNTSLNSWSDKDRDHARELMMALLMKAADISNVARPFDISSRWARTLMNEFARQGELESELSMPTCLFGGPPNKEDILAAAQSQKGFMSLFGFPLFSGMREVMPSVACAIAELEKNTKIWEEKIAYEKQRRETDVENAPLTFSSVSKEEVEEAKIRHRRSEPLAVPEAIPHVPTSPTKRKPVLDSALASEEHPAHEQRQHLTLGMSENSDLRASSPALPAPAIPMSQPGGASRRSSKDVALDSLQHHSTFAHTALSPIRSPESRRASADAGWSVQQSYPGSRRGSKDESLTAILVTSQGSPRKSSPSSPGMTPRPSGSPSKQSRKRHSMSAAPVRDSASRYSAPSSRSHATSSATMATTTHHSPSTQPSSLTLSEDDATPPIPQNQGQSVADDPFLVPGNWPNDRDSTRSSPSDVSLQPPPVPGDKVRKADSPRNVARMASGESEDASGRGTPRKDRGVRESRSRSRLRGLTKFWKKKRDVSGVEGNGGDGGSP